MPSSAADADSMLARQAPLFAAARLLADRGVYGLVWLHDDLTVRARYGKLVDFVEIGEPVTGFMSPLVGLEPDIQALRYDANAAVNLPAVTIVTADGNNPKFNFLVLWSQEDAGFLLLASRAVTKADLEIELSRQIRARLMTEAELQRKSADLLRANRDLEEFAAIISHDLRAPLRAMRYLADDIEAELAAGNADSAPLMLDRLRQQSTRMSQMLSSLLDYSSIGRKDEVQARTDTLALVKSILHSTSAPPDLHIELHGEWPVIDTQEALLDLVLRNLISNAISHHDRDQGVIRIIAQHGQNDLEIAVHDDGPGIAKEHQAAIFLPFRTLAPPGTEGGQGMGLSFVKRTIETVNGKLSVESDPERARGTTFKVNWPKKLLIR